MHCSSHWPHVTIKHLKRSWSKPRRAVCVKYTLDHINFVQKECKSYWCFYIDYLLKVIISEYTGLNKIYYWNSFHLFLSIFQFVTAGKCKITYVVHVLVPWDSTALNAALGALRFPQCALSYELAKQSLSFSFLKDSKTAQKPVDFYLHLSKHIELYSTKCEPSCVQILKYHLGHYGIRAGIKSVTRAYFIISQTYEATSLEWGGGAAGGRCLISDFELNWVCKTKSKGNCM